MKGFLEKLFIIEGIIFGIIGVLFFVNSFSTFVSLVRICSLLLIIAGAITFIRAFLSPYKTLLITNSLISILFGVILLFSPIETMNTLAIFFGIFAIIRGIYLIILSIKYKSFGFNINTIYYILVIILGLLILFNPFTAVLATPYIIGAFFILTAVCEIYLGFVL